VLVNCSQASVQETSLSSSLSSGSSMGSVVLHPVSKFPIGTSKNRFNPPMADKNKKNKVFIKVTLENFNLSIVKVLRYEFIASLIVPYKKKQIIKHLQVRK
jgi:hypothetical protein